MFFLTEEASKQASEQLPVPFLFLFLVKYLKSQPRGLNSTNKYAPAHRQECNKAITGTPSRDKKTKKQISKHPNPPGVVDKEKGKKHRDPPGVIKHLHPPGVISNKNRDVKKNTWTLQAGFQSKNTPAPPRRDFKICDSEENYTGANWGLWLKDVLLYLFWKWCKGKRNTKLD